MTSHKKDELTRVAEELAVLVSHEALFARDHGWLDDAAHYAVIDWRKSSLVPLIESALRRVEKETYLKAADMLHKEYMRTDSGGSLCGLESRLRAKAKEVEK